MTANRWRSVILGVMAWTACASPLDLPPPPGDEPPAIDAVEPARAFAGQWVRLRGKGLATTGGPAQVRFGSSYPATQVEGDSGSLRVRVPDDASAGAIHVSTPAGKAAAEFDYAGLGRPRSGALGAFADLRFATRRTATFGSRRAFLDTERWDAVIVAVGPFQNIRLEGRDFADLWSRDDQLFVLHDGFGPDTDGKCGGRITRYSGDTAVDSTPFQFHAPTGCGRPMGLTLDEDDQAMVLDVNGGVVAVDLSTGASAPLVGGISSNIVACSGRFVVAGWLPGDARSTLLGIEKRSNGWATFAMAVLGEETVGAIACDGKSIALAHGASLASTAGVALWKVQGDTATLESKAELGASSLGYGSLAFSSDGSRLFYSELFGGRVVTYGVSQGQQLPPLVSQSVDSPGAIEVLADGTFLVGSAGGARRFSQATGLPVDDLREQVSPHAPTLRQALVDGASARTSGVMELASNNTGRIIRLSPRSLQRLDLPLIRPSIVGASVSDAGGDQLLLLSYSGDSLLRIGPGLPPEQDGPLTSPADEYFHGVTMTVGGRSFAAPHGNPQDVTGIFVGDTAGPIATAHVDLPVPQRPDAAGSSNATGAVFANATTLAWVMADGVHLLDLEAARQGRAEGRFVAVPFGNAPGYAHTYAAAMDERTLVIIESNGASEGLPVHVIRLVDGALVTRLVPGQSSTASALVSPGLRHLWWQSSSERGQTLSGLAFDPNLDPEAPAFGARDEEITLPGLPGPLVISPDGEAIHFVDLEHDQLWRIE